MGGSADGKNNEFLEYTLLRKNTKYMENNAKAWARNKKASVGDRFRVLAKRKQRGFHRAYLPTFAKTVHTVAAIRANGRVVRDADGNDYVASKILLVPHDSVQANLAPLELAKGQRQAAYRAARGA